MGPKSWSKDMVVKRLNESGQRVAKNQIDLMD